MTKMYLPKEGADSKQIGSKIDYKLILAPFRKDLALVEESLQNNFHSGVALIPQISDYLIGGGGKRIRPLLVLVTSSLLGYEAPTNSHDPRIDYSVVAEYIHAATLLHDDVVDEGDRRRGKLSANREYGNQASILVGDFLFARAYEILASGSDLRVVSAMTHATKVLAEGEVLQLVNSFSLDNTEEVYLETIYRKTAVLISACCKIGALLGNGSEEQIKALAEYGHNTGMAFQLLDDVLDYIATDDKWGKPLGADLAEGKVTLPLIQAYSKANTQEKEIIKSALQTDEVSQEMFQSVLDVVKRADAINYAYDMARNYADEAKRRLDIFEPSSQLSALLAIADYIVDRQI